MNVFLGMDSFARHMSDEGHQLQQGMKHNGYALYGKSTSLNVAEILHKENPEIIIVQDEREWNPLSPCCLNKDEKYYNTYALFSSKALKVGIIKDAHWFKYWDSRLFYKDNGIEHFICYYDKPVVERLSGCKNLIRTHHSVNKFDVPRFTETRHAKAILSGVAVASYYPLRTRLIEHRNEMPQVDYYPHPGYKAVGTHTASYLKLLSNYPVAICTASSLQYALRKLIEASACGCKVITNYTGMLPIVDHNLIRIHDNITIQEMNEVIKEAILTWNADEQWKIAKNVCEFYDYKETTRRLAKDLKNYV